MERGNHLPKTKHTHTAKYIQIKPNEIRHFKRSWPDERGLTWAWLPVSLAQQLIELLKRVMLSNGNFVLWFMQNIHTVLSDSVASYHWGSHGNPYGKSYFFSRQIYSAAADRTNKNNVISLNQIQLRMQNWVNGERNLACVSLNWWRNLRQIFIRFWNEFSILILSKFVRGPKWNFWIIQVKGFEIRTNIVPTKIWTSIYCLVRLNKFATQHTHGRLNEMERKRL